MIDERDLFDEVVGGGDVVSEFTNSHALEVDKSSIDMLPVTKTDRQLILLMSLHPQLQPSFRKNSLSKLSEGDKVLLLKDMQAILGIEPLRGG